MDKFSTRLRFLRNLTGMTQVQVADFLKLNRVTYAGYESGRSEPNICTLIQIADFFNVSLDFLCGVTTYSFKNFNII